MAKTRSKTCTIISLQSDKYLRSYRERQNRTPQELTPYDLLDALNNLYALPKNVSYTCTKFHYDPISITKVIAKKRMGPPEANPYDLLDAPNSLTALTKAASKTLTKFHYDPMSISEIIAEKQNGTPWELTPYDLLDVLPTIFMLCLRLPARPVQNVTTIR